MDIDSKGLQKAFCVNAGKMASINQVGFRFAGKKWIASRWDTMLLILWECWFREAILAIGTLVVLS